MELKEAGLAVGERRVGRLMRLNRIKPVRTRKHKVTTDSHHSLGVAANWLDGNFVAAAPNQKWASDITYGAPRPGWSGVHMTGMQRRKEETNECLALCCEGA